MKREKTLAAHIEIALDELHEALREARTDHTVYPFKESPATRGRAQRLTRAVMQYGHLLDDLHSRAERLQQPEDFADFERFQRRFGALIESFPMPPTGDDHDHTIH